jgi:hypothetical protein
MESSRLQGYANPHAKKFQFHLKQDTSDGKRQQSPPRRPAELKSSTGWDGV